MPHPSPRPNHPKARPGFTLVELTIVVLMLSILAAMVLPKLSSGADESRIAATAAIVKSVDTTIQYAINHPNNVTGTIPPTVDPDWFADKQLPTNPFDEDFTGPRVWSDATASASQTHPVFKTFRGAGVFWYNPRNGRFRALIPDQGTEAENLQLYNEVNSCNISAWDQVTGG